MVDPVTEREAYDEISAYTLTHGSADFIHQHVVDAFAAQHAKPDGKPIGITFALAGLYLHVEKGFSGPSVQRAHMQMARQRRWPRFVLPRRIERRSSSFSTSCVSWLRLTTDDVPPRHLTERIKS
jgi:hypothetical protein